MTTKEIKVKEVSGKSKGQKRIFEGKETCNIPKTSMHRH